MNLDSIWRMGTKFRNKDDVTTVGNSNEISANPNNSFKAISAAVWSIFDEAVDVVVDLKLSLNKLAGRKE